MKLKNIRVSNLITSSRILFVAIFAALVSFEPELFGLYIGLLIIGLIFFTDFLDGFVARKFEGESKFGAVYDIVGDRVAEVVLLVPFTYLNIASPLIIIYFVVKDFLIDYIRLKKFTRSNQVPFKQIDNRISKFLVSSRPMRSSYAILKMIMIFSFYFYIFEPSSDLETALIIISFITVVVSVLRTAPAMAEYAVNNYFEKK